LKHYAFTEDPIIVKTFEAATIYGEISDASFNNGPIAYVTVFIGDSTNKEVYTKIEFNQEVAGVDEKLKTILACAGSRVLHCN
jgi:hypothetical protein